MAREGAGAMSLSAIRQGLADAAATLGLRAYATMPDLLTVPEAGAFVVVIDPGDELVSYDADMDGGATYTLRGRVYAGRVDDTRAQNLLDGYLAPSGSGSLKAALESDQRLGDAGVSYVQVSSASGYGEYPEGDSGVVYLGVELIMEVAI